MKDYRITIEPISPEARRRHVGKLVALQAATLGPRQLVAHSLFAFIRDVSNRELRNDLSRLMLADMMGVKPCEEVERHESRHGMPTLQSMPDELLAALFGGKRGPRN